MKLDEKTPLRLIVGARKSFAIPGSLVIDLDAPPYLDLRDMVEIAQTLLVNTEGSPYFDEPELAERAARFIAEKSAGVSIYASFAAQQLIESGDANYAAALDTPMNLSAYLDRFLDSFGNDKTLAAHVLKTLSNAPAGGMTSKELVIAVFGSASSEPLNASQLSRILNQISSLVFVSDTDDGALTYRFIHTAIGEFFHRLGDR